MISEFFWNALSQMKLNLHKAVPILVNNACPFYAFKLNKHTDFDLFLHGLQECNLPRLSHILCKVTTYVDVKTWIQQFLNGIFCKQLFETKYLSRSFKNQSSTFENHTSPQQNLRLRGVRGNFYTIISLTTIPMDNLYFKMH